MMIEVFKTNVVDRHEAKMLLDAIHTKFVNCQANFDLDDCDRILRVVSDGSVHVPALIRLLNDSGFEAEILPDEMPDWFRC